MKYLNLFCHRVYLTTGKPDAECQTPATFPQFIRSVASGELGFLHCAVDLTDCESKLYDAQWLEAEGLTDLTDALRVVAAVFARHK